MKKFNSAEGAGICDVCSSMLWTGHHPNVHKLIPYNYYNNEEMFCTKCDPYLAMGVSKEVISRKTYDRDN